MSDSIRNIHVERQRKKVKVSFFTSINNICLHILVFSIVFEFWNPMGLSGTLSLPFLASILYIASSLPEFSYKYDSKLFKKYGSVLFVFIIVCILSSAFNSVHIPSLIDLLKTRFFQLIILALFIAIHLNNNPKLINEILITYTLGVFLLFLLGTLGIEVEYVSGRIFIFGENPNGIGTKAMISFIILLHFLYTKKKSIIKIVLILVAMIGCLNLLVLSGSRGALLFLVFGIFALTLFSNIGVLKKTFLIVIGIVFTVLLINYILENNQEFAIRIIRSIQTGETGRDRLWDSALNIFIDNTLLGVGVTQEATLIEMFKEGGRFRNPHNIFLWLLMSTGIIGFGVFVYFLYRLGKDLYKQFKINKNVLYLVIFILLLSFLSKQGGAIRSMFGWMFIGLLIGSTSITTQKID